MAQWGSGQTKYSCAHYITSISDPLRAGGGRGDVGPLPVTHLGAIRLPSDGTGGLAVELHYVLKLLAFASHQKELVLRLASSAGVLFNMFGLKEFHRQANGLPSVS